MANKNIDKAKGRVKKATGALTGNRRLKNEGRADHAKGSVKQRRGQGLQRRHGPEENPALSRRAS